MKLTPELQICADSWKNEDGFNNALHAEFTDKVNADPLLKEHRDFVESNQHGFGDRPFHHVWKMLIDQMPHDFTFLEVGVFKGQVLSLVELLTQRTVKNAKIYGITTLENTRDVRCQYPAGNYHGWIAEIYTKFGLSIANTTLWTGKSNDALLIAKARANHFDIVYVDGGHDYDDVVQDIKAYADTVKVGGFLVMDDASIGRLNIGTCWPGLEDVARAVKEHLDTDKRFRFIFACGHLNVFQRIA